MTERKSRTDESVQEELVEPGDERLPVILKKIIASLKKESNVDSRALLLNKLKDLDDDISFKDLQTKVRSFGFKLSPIHNGGGKYQLNLEYLKGKDGVALIPKSPSKEERELKSGALKWLKETLTKQK